MERTRTKVKVVEPIKEKELIKAEVRAEELIIPLLPKEIKEIPILIRPKLTYRNVGGVLRIKRLDLIVRNKETFSAYPEQIPVAFRKTIICISDPELQKQASLEERVFPTKENLYKVDKAKTEGWFNVINETSGKIINEKSLKLPDAERLRDSLNI